MKQFFLNWLGWFCFLSATVSIIGETCRYINGDFVVVRALFVCTIASLFVTIWWHLLKE